MPLTVPLSPDRNHIAPSDLRRWAKHFHVTPEVIQAAIDKVGNAVAAVGGELKRRDLEAASKPQKADGEDEQSRLK